MEKGNMRVQYVGKRQNYGKYIARTTTMLVGGSGVAAGAYKIFQ